MPPRSSKRKPPPRAAKPPAPETSPPASPSSVEEEGTPEAPPAAEEHKEALEPVKEPEASAEDVASVTLEDEIVVQEAVVVVNMADTVPEMEDEEEEAKVAEEAGGEKDPLPVAAESGEDLEKDQEDDTGDEESEDGEEEVDAEEEDSEEEVEEEAREGEADDAERSGADEGAGQESDGDSSGNDDDDEGNEEDDPSVYMQVPLTERKKQKEYDIYIGGLHKEAVNDDLIKVFGACGEIQSVRIVKHPTTQKSRGFAFIRYKTIEGAKKAIADFKDGTEVRGKKVRISATQDNNTLYLGNICKTWTRNDVIEALKGFGVEHVEDTVLPDDPKNGGHIKGFAFLEFSSHADAMSAFHRLRKADAVFGCDRSAKVAFGQTPMNPSEETMLQVKTVYVEGIPLSWDEEKVKEICKQYGEIEKVQLSRYFKSKKRKDFGFVTFTSRESAISCVEGINNAQLGEGEVKVKANLAKPQYKSRLAKRGARGGFKVQKNGEGEKDGSLNGKKNIIESKEVHGKGKTGRKLKNARGNKPLKIQSTVTEDKKGVPNHAKTGQPSKGKKRGRRGIDTVTNGRQSKKARNIRNSANLHVRPSSGYGKRKNIHFGKPEARYVTPVAYASRYAEPATSYGAYSYGGASGSKRHHSDLISVHHSDMEPHAGYIPPVQQVQNPYGYDHRRSSGYANQPRIGSAYEEAIPLLQTSYPGYASYASYESGYAYPSSGAYTSHGPYH